MAVEKSNIKVGDKFKYHNFEFTVLEKQETGVTFYYEGRVYFREYIDIEKIQ